MPSRGIKTWATGDVLQAADVNEYLAEQVIMVFDDSSDRDSDLAAGPTATEGMTAYLKDVNQVTYYDGSAWVRMGTYAEVQAVESRVPRMLIYMEVY